MEWIASTLHTISEHGVSSITTNNKADAHTSAASSRLNWRPRRFKWTRTFRWKTKSGFCTCAIIFQTQSTSVSCCTDRLHLNTNNINIQETPFFAISQVYDCKFHIRLSPILCLFTQNLTTLSQWQGAKVWTDDNVLSLRKTFHKNRAQYLHGRTNIIHLQLPSDYSAAGRHLKRPSLPL